MHDETLAIHAGRYPFKNNGSVNQPIYNTSTVLFPTLQDYRTADSGKSFYDDTVKSYDYSYGIGYNPTVFAFQETLAKLEGADHALALPSGLSAIATTLMAFVKSGDHVLITDSIYGPTRRFCNTVLKKFGVETTYYPPSVGEGISEYIQDNTRLVFTEAPGSFTFEVQDIPAISKAAKAVREDIVIVMDNSWATPLYYKPYDKGVDVVVHAVTKYMGGHSDIILGAITTNDAHFKDLFRSFHFAGTKPSANDCYLAARGIRTMANRVKQHEKSALEIATWLESHPKVTRMLHPAFESCEGHEIWKRDFTGSTGLFSFLLDKKYSFEALCAFVNDLEYFGIGASWGGYESLVMVEDISTIRNTTDWSNSNSMVRLYIGLENVADLQDDLEKGLERLF